MNAAVGGDDCGRDVSLRAWRPVAVGGDSVLAQLRSGSWGRPGFTDKQNAHPEAAREQGRGREADTPTEIRHSGGRIFLRVYEEFGRDRVMSVAAGVTFYALLALFPAIAALVSIYGLFADPATIQDHLNALWACCPAVGSTSSASR